MGEFRMPSLGADMDTGTLVEWRVAAGDHVRRGDIVAVVDTDKATIDVEVFETGVVEALLVEPGTTVPVGTALARIGAGDAGPTTTRPDAPAPPAAPVPPVAAVTPAAATPVAPTAVEAPPLAVPAGPGHRHASVVLSPVVRHLAERLHVETAHLAGTGAGGRLTRADVEAAAAVRTVRRHGRAVSPRARRAALGAGGDQVRIPAGPSGAVHERDVLAAAALPGPTHGTAPTSPRTGDDRLTASRRATARGMERSNREIPHYHLTTTVDLEGALDWLSERNAGRPPQDQVLPAAVLLRAAALAAVAVPDVNGWWLDGDLRHAEGVDLGMAVSLRAGGLVTPTIVDADTLPLDELMATLRDVVDRARHGALRSSELAQASLTVTSLGDRGADVVHGVIHPPQVALVGYGRIDRRPVVVGDRVEARRCVVATLAADHRASDGHVGSRFLRRVEQLLTHPERLDT